MSNSLTALWRGYARTHKLPLVEDLERGMKAVRHLVDYGAARRRFAASPHASFAAMRSARPRLAGGLDADRGREQEDSR